MNRHIQHTDISHVYGEAISSLNGVGRGAFLETFNIDEYDSNDDETRDEDSESDDDEPNPRIYIYWMPSANANDYLRRQCCKICRAAVDEGEFRGYEEMEIR